MSVGTPLALAAAVPARRADDCVADLDELLHVTSQGIELPRPLPGDFPDRVPAAYHRRLIGGVGAVDELGVGSKRCGQAVEVATVESCVTALEALRVA
jgi:hypothetical protein